jgi:hypothetical protein
VLIDIPVFAGTRPLVAPRLLEQSQAQLADNCLVKSGNLRPLRRLLVQERIGVLGVEDIVRYDGAWLCFFEPVSLCRSLANADEHQRMYYTGRDSGPMMFRRAAGGGAAAPVRLGLPAPAAKPTVAVQGTGSGDTFSAYWVWTWVSDLGEESAPSLASDVMDCKPGQSFVVSGMAMPEITGRNPAAKKRLYRGNAGTSATAEQFVAEFDAALTSFTDTVLSKNLGETLVTEGWLPPPDGLQGLVAVRGGALAGFVGNKVYFCEPYAPYAWPRKYMQSLEHEVVALAAIGSALVVLTDASAYLIPCDDITATAPIRLDGYTPCASARGVVTMRAGVLFPGVDGLYLVPTGATTARNLTAGLISEEDWQAMQPQTMRAWGLGDEYIAFHQDTDGRKRGFLYDLAAPETIRGLDMHATCGWLEPEGRKLHLGFQAGGRTAISLWEGDSARYSAQWRSKIFRFPAPQRMAAARVEADFPELLTEQQYLAMREAMAASYAEELSSGELGAQLGTAMFGATMFGSDILDSVRAAYAEEPVVTFQVFADGREVYSRNVTSAAPFTLPDVSGSEWEVLVAGAVPVRRIGLATSMAELRAMS